MSSAIGRVMDCYVGVAEDKDTKFRSLKANKNTEDHDSSDEKSDGEEEESSLMTQILMKILRVPVASDLLHAVRFFNFKVHKTVLFPSDFFIRSQICAVKGMYP